MQRCLRIGRYKQYLHRICITPFSRGKISMGKHNLLVNVPLLTHFAMNPCSAMHCVMISQQEAGCRVAQITSMMSPGPALHSWAMKLLQSCLACLRATVATKTCDTCCFPSHWWGRRVSSLTYMSQCICKQFTPLIRAANAENLVKQGNTLSSVTAKHRTVRCQSKWCRYGEI